MSTTFLQASQEICTRLRTSGSGPTAVTGQPAEYQRIISLVKKAHKEIVLSHTDWEFLWTSGSVEFSNNNNPHTATPTDIKKFDEKTFVNVLDGTYLDSIRWSDYKKSKLTPDELLTTGSPEQFTIRPDKRIVVIPNPTVGTVFNVNFDYWRQPTELTAIGTILDIPDDSIETLYALVKMYFLEDEEGPNYDLARSSYMYHYKFMEEAHWPNSDTSSMAEDQELVVTPE